jgi:hypothetical protein
MAAPLKKMALWRDNGFIAVNSSVSVGLRCEEKVCLIPLVSLSGQPLGGHHPIVTYCWCVAKGRGRLNLQFVVLNHKFCVENSVVSLTQAKQSMLQLLVFFPYLDKHK